MHANFKPDTECFYYISDSALCYSRLASISDVAVCYFYYHRRTLSYFGVPRNRDCPQLCGFVFVIGTYHMSAPVWHCYLPIVLLLNDVIICQQ